MKKFRKLLMIAACLLFSITAFANGIITGAVFDAGNNESLVGVSVVLKGTTTGTTTDFDGKFQFSAPATNHTVVISFVGYVTKEIKVNVRDGETTDLGVIQLESSTIGLAEVSILASVAISRKTPVALSTIEPQRIENKLGTQEFPEILKSTPGIYATKQGGAFGDSRVNIRGFDSRNVAVMINGVPVNDMEGGKVYWSNWAGLADVTRSMQVQRGLGAIKTAVPSIGGTINVLTNTTDAKKGGSIFSTMGNDGYKKFGLMLSSGLTKNGWASSILLSKTTGNGYVDGTEFEGYSYFFNLSKRINDQHMIAFSLFGAPQWHGQRYYPQRILAYKNSDREIKYNPHWGYKNGQVTYERKNYYHKPQAMLNHYWTMSEQLSLTTSLYGSIGTGGGVRGYGETGKFKSYLREGQVDFDRIVDENIARGKQGSETVLRALENNHSWYGVLSTLRYEANDITLSLGLDGRYYKGEHYSKIEDLLGGEFYVDDSDINVPNKIARVDDKVSYYNDGLVNWLGTFAQVEYTRNKLSTFINLAVSHKRYKRKDYFIYENSDPLRETGWENFLGYSAKGGANYNFDEKHNIFFNAGYFERQPDFTSVFLNYENTVNKDAENEKVISGEFGYGFKNKFIRANLNLYYTQWKDKTFIKTGEDENTGALLTANILGVDAQHMGIEFDFIAKPVDNLTVLGMISIGDWTWLNDIEGAKLYDEDQNEVGTYNLYVKDLHVGDAAQTTAALGLDYELFEGFNAGFDYNYYANLYAEFDPLSRDDASDRTESWRLPEYHLFDASFRYSFKMGEFDAVFYANVHNLLDTEYFSEANDGTGHNWETADVYYGLGRTWSMGLKIRF